MRKELAEYCRIPLFTFTRYQPSVRTGSSGKPTTISTNELITESIATERTGPCEQSPRFPEAMPIITEDHPADSENGDGVFFVLPSLA